MSLYHDSYHDQTVYADEVECEVRSIGGQIEAVLWRSAEYVKPAQIVKITRGMADTTDPPKTIGLAKCTKAKSTAVTMAVRHHARRVQGPPNDAPKQRFLAEGCDQDA